jgi:periplasmic protein TonB
MTTTSFFRKYDRTFFLLLGMAFSLTLMLSAFHWSAELTQAQQPRHWHDQTQDIDIEVIQMQLPKPVEARAARASANANQVEVTFEPLLQTIEPPRIATFGLPEVLPEGDSVEPDFTPVREAFPVFPGGDAALLRYLSENARYTTAARENGVQGIVYISFVVKADGSIGEVTVLRGLGFGLDEMAIKIVKAMPRWQPGYQGGKAVAVNYNIPIRFSLK